MRCKWWTNGNVSIWHLHGKGSLMKVTKSYNRAYRVGHWAIRLAVRMFGCDRSSCSSTTSSLLFQPIARKTLPVAAVWPLARFTCLAYIVHRAKFRLRADLDVDVSRCYMWAVNVEQVRPPKHIFCLSLWIVIAQRCMLFVMMWKINSSSSFFFFKVIT